MRTFMVRMICLSVFLVGLCIIIGCGSQDVLDQNQLRYQVTNISFTDADADGVLTIDALQDECDGNLTIIDDGGTPLFAGDDVVAGDDPETFTDVFASITISVPINTPGLTLEGYTVEYIGEDSANGTGTVERPPDLADLLDQGSNRISLPSATTTTFTIPCMTVESKAEYLNAAGWTTGSAGVDENGDGIIDFHIPVVNAPTLSIARYTISITLFFKDEFGEDLVKTESRTILISNYDNC